LVSVGLVQRSSAELFLSSEIHAFIAQHLKVDVASMDAHSHLTEDFGLDLFLVRRFPGNHQADCPEEVLFAHPWSTRAGSRSQAQTRQRPDGRRRRERPV